jgi:serine/threonine protein kinase
MAKMEIPSSDEFAGTDRFQLLRCIGEGGMGVVYEALDRETKSHVALKTMRQLNGTALLHFKNEFRALQDIDHPNLVSLGELVQAGGRWFFTMELVEGDDFIRYVRTDGGRTKLLDTQAGRSTQVELRRAAPILQLPETLHEIDRSTAETTPGFNEGRLRSALGQLARGIVALHEAGKIHRDIKPSNVLVSSTGRVVLLDFGLVTGIAAVDQSQSVHIVGTVPYMAPERAASRPVGPEADWYGVGVMLYEALTGRLPFSGNAFEMMMQKQRSDPPPPRSLFPQVPADLDALCCELLRFDPAARATGSDVLSRLGAEPLARTTEPSRSRSSGQRLFVGRESELQILDEAYQVSRRGAAVTVVVRGESGMGKTALVRQFLDRLLVDESGPVILSGRCFERESVPFKAIDGVIDALCRQILLMPEAEAGALLPRAAALLGDAFPVLRRVRAVAQAPRLQSESRLDPLELRTRLFAATRELVTRLADRRPLVIFIDDLQWADSDSLALIGEVMRPPDAPALLVVATLRDGGTDAVADGQPAGGEPVAARLSRFLVGDVRRIQVGPLPPGEASELAALLLQRESAAINDSAESIAAEARGHPLFIQELVRHAQQHGDRQAVPLLLDDVLWARVLELPPAARSVLELAAVAGTPIAHEVMARAVGTSLSTLHRNLAILRVGNLVQTTGPRGSDTIHVYHDRVREALVAHLDGSAAADAHRELALALEAEGRGDPRQLAVYWRGAGDRERAAGYTLRAAADAEAGFAFDHAARLYRTALELHPPDHPSVYDLHLKLAEALANAGRGAESALSYFATARGASKVEAVEYTRLAADQLLRSGHIDEGLDAIRQVLQTMRLGFPSTPRRALASIVLRRLQLRLRGLRFRERDATQVPPETLRRIELCLSIGTCLGIVDFIRGANFSSRALLLALRAGEPKLLLRALALETVFVSTGGVRAGHRADGLLARTGDLAALLGTAEARFFDETCRGFSFHLRGRFRAAVDHFERAEAAANECRGRALELNAARLTMVFALHYLGRMADLSRRVPRQVAESTDRGDLYGATNFELGLPGLAWLATDDFEESRRRARDASGRWSQRGFQMQHWYALQTAGHLGLYGGDARTAYTGLMEKWPALTGSLLLRVQLIHCEIRSLRARLALAAAGEIGGEQGRRLLLEAERDARRLRRLGAPWIESQAQLILAGVAATRGDDEQAVRLLREAAAGFDAADMALYAAAARRRLGALLGGDAGLALREAADSWMASEKIRAPARFTAIFAPGFRD